MLVLLISFLQTSALPTSTPSLSVTPNTTSHDASYNSRQGWTQSPNQRGTIDILWSCIFTMFLCSWSILCLNVPSPKDSALHIFHRRFWLTCLCFLGPEFTLLNAAGQWVSARRSVEDFAKAKIEGWTLYHGFFADMGGFTLHPRDSTPFPVDARQLLFLIQQGLVTKPDLSRKAIADKNKVDGLLRVITVCQVLWFASNIAGRKATGLAVTCAELTTSAFIVCTIGTVVFWLRKPADVRVAVLLESPYSVAEISEIALSCFPDIPYREGSGAGEHRRHEHYYGKSPLDFISRKEWHWSLYWTNWINILRHMGINFAPKELPVDRFENTTFLEVSPKIYICCLIITSIYTSIFAMAWNYDFPTTTEKILWRASSVSILGCLVAFSVVTEATFTLSPMLRRFWRQKNGSTQLRTKGSRSDDQEKPQPLIRAKISQLAASIRNNSPDKDPALEVPLRALLPLYVIAVFYCTARTYILVSDLVELRALPASAYETVDWSAFLPHL